MAEPRRLKLDEHGLIPAIVQDRNTGAVLMVAYMNEESVRRTVETGDAWFWSRSRRELWHKGSTSGNYQHVARMRVDCDADAILLEVDPAGPACHTGATSCFFESIDDFLGPASATGEGEGVANGESHADNPPGISAEASRVEADASPGGAAIVDELAQVIAERHATMPEGSYVAQLLAAGIDRVAKKVGEEAAETIIAAKNGSHEEIVWEVADLWFHTLVLLEASGVPVESVWKELARRRK